MKTIHTIKLKCQSCGKEIEVKVTSEEIARYHQGVLIQNAFPNLNAEQREMILSGTCTECWDKMFPPEEIPTQPFN